MTDASLMQAKRFQDDMTQHCGLVAIVGAPNAGKSTLVNALVGQKVAIVSPKAQTTRARLMGVAIEGETQLLLVDTPGIFEPKRRLDRAMVAAAWGGAEGADLIALVVDAKGGLGPKVQRDRREPRRRGPSPSMLILNKVDIADKAKLLRPCREAQRALSRSTKPSSFSATTGDGVPELKARARRARCPRGRGIFPRTRSPTRPSACSPPK